MTSLDLALLYLVAAVLGVVACRSLKLPPMLGYLAVGVTIGPNALAFAHDSASIQYLAEFGVVFLMFVIGLEFNLPKLRALKTAVFGLGLAQVVLTIAGAMLGNALLVAGFAALGWAWDLGWRGCSTASASPIWRWTSTPTACARPPPPARTSCSATRPRCRA